MDTESDPHLRWLSLAQNVSMLSDYKMKVGAVLIKKGRPISVGYNKQKSPNKRFITKFNTTHAEICALACSGKIYINKATIVVYRQDKKGNPKLSRPCEHCLLELKKFGVRRIIYSICESPYWREEKI